MCGQGAATKLDKIENLHLEVRSGLVVRTDPSRLTYPPVIVPLSLTAYTPRQRPSSCGHRACRRPRCD